MNAIEVRDVHKNFKIYYDKGATLKEKILFRNRNKHEIHQVLKGITFSVEKGEVVGLIGENGCGKSTLLKLMTRIMYPDKGSIEVNGKVSSLIELGAGFHPDMTGRENIYTNASIFGLSKKEIDKRINDIITFSELGEFIDNPVRTYSSGMYMRLAFSVAINVDAEILLVDEILAVGDAAFQAKCFSKMQQIKREGTTIVIVSHDLGSIERLCDRSIWINEGHLARDGRPKEVAGEYLNSIMSREGKMELAPQQVEEITDEVIEETNEEVVSNEKRWGNKEIKMTSIKLVNSENKEITKIHTGDEVKLVVEFEKSRPIDTFEIGIGINSVSGVIAYGTNTAIDSKEVHHTEMKGRFECVLEKLNLIQGEYYMDIALHTIEGKPYDYFCEAIHFSVYSEIGDIGVARIEHKWIVDENELV